VGSGVPDYRGTLERDEGIPMGRPRVFILYGTCLFAKGLECLLKDKREVELLGIDSKGPRALARIRSLQPDVVIVEAGKRMPEPCLVLHRLLREHPQVRVVRVSLEDSNATLYSGRRFNMVQPQDLVGILLSSSHEERR
jgi:DNA-binding NarL/FixJ family response regulator